MRPTFKTTVAALVGAALMLPTAFSDIANADGISSTQQPLVAANSQPADPGEYPFAVRLTMRRPVAGAMQAWNCSGSLIHPRWVLTAAHCVTFDGPAAGDEDGVFAATNVTATIGRSDLAVATSGDQITADRVVIQQGWQPNGDWDDDVALVRLSTASTARPVELASPYRFDEVDTSGTGDTMTQLGYGLIGADQSDDNFLREGTATLGFVPAVGSIAQSSYSVSGGLACSGDSGGPWLVKHHDGTWRQFAVESNGTIPVCGGLEKGTTVRSRAHYDWIVQNVYPDGMGRWLTRPMSSSTLKISDGWTSNEWRTGWSIQEFVRIGGVTHVFLYRDDTGEVQIRPMKSDGTPGPSVSDANWTEGWTSIKPYNIGGRAFLFEIKVSDGTAAIDELKRNPSTGEVTLVEQERFDWSSGWTIAQPFVADSGHGLFLLKEATGEVKTFELYDKAPWVSPVSTPAYQANWTSGWSHAGFFGVWGGTYLYLMKDATGEVKFRRMDGLKVGASYRDETVGPGWSSAEVSRMANGSTLTLLNRHTGALQVRRLNEAPASSTNSMFGPVLQTMNIKDGNTQAKPFCLGDLLVCPTGQMFLWNYREGRI